MSSPRIATATTRPSNHPTGIGAHGRNLTFCRPSTTRAAALPPRPPDPGRVRAGVRAAGCRSHFAAQAKRSGAHQRMHLHDVLDAKVIRLVHDGHLLWGHAERKQNRSPRASDGGFLNAGEEYAGEAYVWTLFLRGNHACDGRAAYRPEAHSDGDRGAWVPSARACPNRQGASFARVTHRKNRW
jgi:hypothetical protein